MSELGLRLKTAREEKGYSLEELQKLTKIQKRYLVAIEEGEFSRLPGDFYARAFVKSYADVVGINSEMLFEEHQDELPKSRREAVELPPRINRPKPRGVKKRSKLTTLLPTFVVVLFILAIIGGIWVLGQNDEDDDSAGVSREDLQNDPTIENSNEISDETNEDNESANEEVNEEDNEIEEPVEEPELEPLLEYNETEGSSSYFTLSNSEVFEVQMQFSGNSWIRIMDSTGENIHENTYQEGDETSFDFSDKTQITFHLGSARTAEIYVNDELIEYPIDNTVQYIIIDFERLNVESE